MVTANAHSIENIIAVVITYHPTQAAIDNILGIIEYYDELVVVDNSEEGSLLKRLAHQNISVIENKNNLGIAEALNQGVWRAKELGADWVSTFDQDSILLCDLPAILKEFLADLDGATPTPILGCDYRNPVVSDISPTAVSEQHILFESATHVITSGMSFSVKTFDKVGDFKSDLFIDYVDYDFCTRAALKGISCYITTTPTLLHSLGDQTKHNFFSREIVTTNHSPLRRYYMIRNCIWYTREYSKMFPEQIRECRLAMFNSCLFMVLFEKQKVKKILYTLKGGWDGLLRRLGRI